MNDIKKILSLLSPTNWPAWFALGCLWLVTRLPYTWQMAAGRVFGRLVYKLSPKLRHITSTNISLCFPELSIAERTHLAKKNFESLGIGLVETAMAWWISDKRLKKSCGIDITGHHYINQCYQQGKGIIILSPHFTCLEMIGRLIGSRYPLAAMYRPHKNHLIAYIQERFRKNYAITQIAKHRMRDVLNTFKNNLALWYAYDIDAGEKHSVFAPFFGIETASLTAISRVAALTGAPVIPIDFARRDDRWGYKINIYAPLENFPGLNFVEDATRLNAYIEKSVRDNPEQYIWQYKRFKTRPAGEKRFY
jgi:KDO2-lipid IV(A) lauroyltransferase